MLRKSPPKRAVVKLDNEQGRRLVCWLVGIQLALTGIPAHAANLAGDFGLLVAWMQELVNFMTGPFGKGAVVISIVAAFITWVFAPKEGIFGPVLRVVVAGIAVLNASIWVFDLGVGKNIPL